MEVNLRSSETIGQAGTAGKVVSVDTSGEDVLPDNPYRNVAHLRVVSGGPITIYFCTNTQRGQISGGGGAGQSITIAAGDPPWQIDRWNGPISAIAAGASVLGVVEYDLTVVPLS